MGIRHHDSQPYWQRELVCGLMGSKPKQRVSVLAGFAMLFALLALEPAGLDGGGTLDSSFSGYRPLSVPSPDNPQSPCLTHKV